MIGSGSGIGRPPGVPPGACPGASPGASSEAPEAQRASEPSTPQKAPDSSSQTQAPSDGFDKARASFERGRPGLPAAGRDPQPADLYRLGRSNPAAAHRIADGMGAQAKALQAEIAQELAGLRSVVAKLSAERFAKGAVERMAVEIRQRRDRLASLKLRYHTSMRKMELLEQIAGQLENPALEQEIESILEHHRKLSTDWGKRHHLLSLGESLFGAAGEDSEEAEEVVHSEVQPADLSADMSDTLQTISPRRVIAELMARTLDGSSRETEPPPEAAARGDLGRSTQSAAKLAGIVDQVLASDRSNKG